MREIFFVFNKKKVHISSRQTTVTGILRVFFCCRQDNNVPMIPLGLKETVDIDFREPFKV